jgi:transcriptional regulator with XRE-family HTH domain
MSFGFFIMKSLAKNVGQAISDLRQRRNWRQTDLALRAGLPMRTIGRVERGTVDVRLSTLYKIASALGTSPKKLLP